MFGLNKTKKPMNNFKEIGIKKVRLMENIST